MILNTEKDQDKEQVDNRKHLKRYFSPQLDTKMPIKLDPLIKENQENKQQNNNQELLYQINRRKQSQQIVSSKKETSEKSINPESEDIKYNQNFVSLENLEQKNVYSQEKQKQNKKNSNSPQKQGKQISQKLILQQNRNINELKIWQNQGKTKIRISSPEILNRIRVKSPVHMGTQNKNYKENNSTKISHIHQSFQEQQILQNFDNNNDNSQDQDKINVDNQENLTKQKLEISEQNNGVLCNNFNSNKNNDVSNQIKKEMGLNNCDNKINKNIDFNQNEFQEQQNSDNNNIHNGLINKKRVYSPGTKLPHLEHNFKKPNFLRPDSSKNINKLQKNNNRDKLQHFIEPEIKMFSEGNKNGKRNSRVDKDGNESNKINQNDKLPIKQQQHNQNEININKQQSQENKSGENSCKNWKIKKNYKSSFDYDSENCEDEKKQQYGKISQQKCFQRLNSEKNISTEGNQSSLESLNIKKKLQFNINNNNNFGNISNKKLFQKINNPHSAKNSSLSTDESEKYLLNRPSSNHQQCEKNNLNQEVSEIYQNNQNLQHINGSNKNQKSPKNVNGKLTTQNEIRQSKNAPKFKINILSNNNQNNSKFGSQNLIKQQISPLARVEYFPSQNYLDEINNANSNNLNPNQNQNKIAQTTQGSSSDENTEGKQKKRVSILGNLNTAQQQKKFFIIKQKKMSNNFTKNSNISSQQSQDINKNNNNNISTNMSNFGPSQNDIQKKSTPQSNLMGFYQAKKGKQFSQQLLQSEILKKLVKGQDKETKVERKIIFKNVFEELEKNQKSQINSKSQDIIGKKQSKDQNKFKTQEYTKEDEENYEKEKQQDLNQIISELKQIIGIQQEKYNKKQYNNYELDNNYQNDDDIFISPPQNQLFKIPSELDDISVRDDFSHDVSRISQMGNAQNQQDGEEDDKNEFEEDKNNQKYPKIFNNQGDIKNVQNQVQQPFLNQKILNEISQNQLNENSYENQEFLYSLTERDSFNYINEHSEWEEESHSQISQNNNNNQSSSSKKEQDGQLLISQYEDLIRNQDNQRKRNKKQVNLPVNNKNKQKIDHQNSKNNNSQNKNFLCQSTQESTGNQSLIKGIQEKSGCQQIDEENNALLRAQEVIINNNNQLGQKCKQLFEGLNQEQIKKYMKKFIEIVQQDQQTQKMQK
ncbi:hypothetical protein PPERSA_00882 [Pseudocohnilembus persalinus]|uniref:Uncharacterized protein n=1 Tax=Pseudocohnilembus persalinus TaxID=266149 RepID=A0A0V0QEQ6_PSEPJ|nr:hypothetical protein PPERSA_00882 [Pseudocohnilembus persalinus]|eukprot:KRX00655.1 hypothetical protein PPERSA_00882 [Pseudocohnilembus persalinus]